jgi:hypothetical protein
MKYFWLLILTAFCTNCAAQISAKDEPLAILGTGQLSCGKWIAAREEKTQHKQISFYSGWLDGLLVTTTTLQAQNRNK